MTLVGMPNPVLWAVAAFLLNYIPYIGALTGIVMVSLVALMSFDSLAYALIPPLLYLFGSIMEGQFITPIFLGRRFGTEFRCDFHIYCTVELVVGNRGCNHRCSIARFNQSVLRPFRGLISSGRISVRP